MGIFKGSTKTLFFIVLVLFNGLQVAAAGLIFADSFEEAEVEPPPEPENFLTSVEFLYPGQPGLDPDVLDPNRVTVIRGKVFDATGSGLPSVTITVLDQPLLGQTASASDGLFNMVVNGGGALIINYQIDGFLPVQRRLPTPWNDYALLPDVVMIPLDSATTSVVDNNSSAQIARANPVNDGRGQRQPTVIFPANTSSTAFLTDGTEIPLASFTVRATEYTVGDKGPMQMPGSLPPTSGYTHAVELSVDEVGIDGSIEFSQPVFYYLENFLEFPVGMAVPTGYYDRKQGLWVASENGIIIKIISVTSGLADIDVDGDDIADVGALIDDIGFADAERELLASQYNIGVELWRAPITHFTPWDCNWPYGPPDGADGPPGADNDNPQDDWGDCEKTGSVIACENQLLGESIPIIGSGISMYYSSRRVPDYKQAFTFEVPITGEILPDTPPKRVDMTVTIAGTTESATFDNVIPNLSYHFQWDGVDAFDRIATKPVFGVATVGYVYDALYQEPSAFDSSFSQLGSGIIVGTDRDAGEFTFQRKIEFGLGLRDVRERGLGGWSFAPHHHYDAHLGTILNGDGTQRQAFPQNLTRIDNTTIVDFYATSDGSILMMDSSHIYRLLTDGTREDIAGFGNKEEDGFPALQTDVRNPKGLAQASDGSIYYLETIPSRLRRIDPNGIVHTVAGSATQSGYTGDGGPAIDALLSGPTSVDIGPDGAIYIADRLNSAIRRIDPSGIIQTIAGGNGTGYSGDGGSALDAKIKIYDLKVASDGTIYFLHGVLSGQYVRAISPDGIITRIAGNQSNGVIQIDGVPATQSKIFSSSIALGSDNSVYIVGSGSLTIFGNNGEIIVNQSGASLRRISPTGIITLIAGGYNSPSYQSATGDGDIPLGVIIVRNAVALTPGNTIIIGGAGGTYAIDQGIVADSDLSSAFKVANEAGTELYIFDINGRHLQTQNLMSNRVLWQFRYRDDGQLASLTNAHGALTVIEYVNDQAVAINAPDQLRTELQFNSNGFLQSVTNPAGNTTSMSYSMGGLLTQFVDAKAQPSIMTYDTLGRLLTDTNRESVAATLTRSELSRGYEVVFTDVNNESSVYSNALDENGAIIRSFTSPTGAVNVTTQDRNGISVASYADGSAQTTTATADPRLGQSANYVSQITIDLPSGLQKLVSNSRALEWEDNFLKVGFLTQTDTTSTGSTSLTRVYDRPNNTITYTGSSGSTVATLDNKGSITSIATDPAFAPIVMTYDSKGRRLSTTQGTTSVTLGYDAANRINQRTNAAGEVTQLNYDDRDRLSSVISPSGRIMAATYDDNGNRTALTLPSGAIHQFSYSANDTLASYTPVGETSSFVIGQREDGSELSLTLPSGRVINRVFDATGRNAGYSYDEGAVTLAYADLTKRITNMTWSPAVGSAQILSFAYDGPLVTNAQWSGVNNSSYTYGYDSDFRINSITFNANSPRAITYDGDSRMTANGGFNYEHNGPAGAVSRVTDSVANFDYSYDTLGRLATRSLTINAVELFSQSIDYDNAKRVSNVSQGVTGNGTVHSYDYDVDGQLFTVSDGTGVIEQYGYDVNGNRTSKGIGLGAHTAVFDTRDRLQSIGVTPYMVDIDGMLSSRGSDTFNYSARGELLTATIGATNINYTYDALQRRVASTVGAETWSYVYGNLDSSFQITASQTPDGIWSEYFYDHGGQLFAMIRSGATFYIVSDQIRSPVAVFDSAGSLVKHIDRDSWGRVISDSAPAFNLPVGFAGGLVDANTGLVKFGLRDYDPIAGRFMTMDPIWFQSGEMNLYGYAQNNPVGNFDSSGFISLGICAFAGPGGCGEISVDPSTGEVGYCVSVGIGGGGGVQLDPFGLPEDSFALELNAGAGIGKVSGDATLGFKFIRCPDGSLRRKFISKAQGNIPGASLNFDENGSPGVVFGNPFSFDAGASASAAAKACRKF